ncbi:hypothetical protein llap_5659 [Limosa lapponica baueri]|uniref:Uncharacterized protein n=1 Tax=Limosa lapponica baueri TaxID=1758121 RepID=A0A2I0UDC5_LIMLA|nr:hypothetical protein llap_5659 [Limosa lapponica baueri]
MRGNQAIDEEYDSIKNNIEEEEKEVGAGWKGSLRSSSPTINLTDKKPSLNSVTKRYVNPSFKCLQGWCLNYFPGQPIPMLNNTFSVKIFPNIQSGTSGSPFYLRLLPDMPGIQMDIDMLIIIGHQLESYLMKLGHTVMLW